MRPNLEFPPVSEIFALQLKNTLSYASPEVMIVPISCDVVHFSVFLEEFVSKLLETNVGMTRENRPFAKEGVEGYPAEARPVIEEFK
jgi:hypothetical protein